MISILEKRGAHTAPALPIPVVNAIPRALYYVLVDSLMYTAITAKDKTIENLISKVKTT